MTNTKQDERKKRLQEQRNKEFDQYFEDYKRESAKVTRKMTDEAERLGDKL